MRVSNNCSELWSCISGPVAGHRYLMSAPTWQISVPLKRSSAPFHFATAKNILRSLSKIKLLKISYFIGTVFDSIRFISFVLSRRFQLEVLLTRVPPPHPSTPISVSVCPSSLSGEVGEVLQPPALLQVQSGLRGAQR